MADDVLRTLAFRVILHRPDGRQVLLVMARPPQTPLEDILRDVLRDQDLPFSIDSWVVRFNGQERSWQMTLELLSRFAVDPKQLEFLPLDIVPRPAPGWAAIEHEETPTQELSLPPAAEAPSLGERHVSSPVTFEVARSTGERREPAHFKALSLPSAAPAERPAAVQWRKAPPQAASVSTAAQEDVVSETVQRRGTVRYYSRMNPERMFPFLVILSEETIQQVVKRHVEQQQSQQFEVALRSVVEIEPIVPGCSCYPPKDLVTIVPGRTQSTFWVVPHVLGSIQHARVVIRQDGNVLAEVPLQIKVVKQTAALVMGLLSLGMPYLSMAMKHMRLDFESQKQEGFPIFAWLGQALFEQLTPGILGAGLLLLTGFLYLLMRPRRRDVFWDITPADPGRHDLASR